MEPKQVAQIFQKQTDFLKRKLKIYKGNIEIEFPKKEFFMEFGELNTFLPTPEKKNLLSLGLSGEFLSYGILRIGNTIAKLSVEIFKELKSNELVKTFSVIKGRVIYRNKPYCFTEIKEGWISNMESVGEYFNRAYKENNEDTWDFIKEKCVEEGEKLFEFA